MTPAILTYLVVGFPALRLWQQMTIYGQIFFCFLFPGHVLLYLIWRWLVKDTPAFMDALAVVWCVVIGLGLLLWLLSS